MSRMPLAVLLTALTMLTAARAAAEGPVVTYDPQAGGVTVVRKADVGDVASRFQVSARGEEEVAAVATVVTVSSATQSNQRRPLLVSARGTREVQDVAGSVTGVLFQAVAKPEDALKSLPVRLSYKLHGKHDAILQVTIGQKQVASESPAWVWATAARFARHPATGAVTLMNRPETANEQSFHRSWKRSHTSGRLVWARYHPMLDDTLVGFYLVAADAMIADAEHLRTMVAGLDHEEKLYGYPSAVNRAKSLRSAVTLDGLMKLEATPGYYSMFNDLDAGYTFAAADGKLRISGTADYHFSGPGDDAPQPLPALTKTIRQNRHLFVESSPVLYRTVEDFGRLVAFFNYVQQRDPQGFAAFVEGLEPVVKRMPRMETPIAVEVSR